MGKIKFRIDNHLKHDLGQELDLPHGKHTILINKKAHQRLGKRELTDTIAHELYHAKHPKASEKKTYAHTKKVMKKMTKSKQAKLLKRI